MSSLYIVFRHKMCESTQSISLGLIKAFVEIKAGWINSKSRCLCFVWTPCADGKSVKAGDDLLPFFFIT